MAGLDQHFARLVAAPGPPANLRDLLIRPLRRAQVAAFEAQVGVDYAHQSKVGEVIALGHQLGADDHVDQLLLGLLNEGADLFRTVERVRRDHGHTRLGHQFGHFVSDALYPRAAGDQAIGGVAFGALFGNAGLVAAVMAGQPA